MSINMSCGCISSITYTPISEAEFKSLLQNGWSVKAKELTHYDGRYSDGISVTLIKMRSCFERCIATGNVFCGAIIRPLIYFSTAIPICVGTWGASLCCEINGCGAGCSFVAPTTYNNYGNGGSYITAHRTPHTTSENPGGFHQGSRSQAEMFYTKAREIRAINEKYFQCMNPCCCPCPGNESEKHVQVDVSVFHQLVTKQQPTESTALIK